MNQNGWQIVTMTNGVGVIAFGRAEDGGSVFFDKAATDQVRRLGLLEEDAEVLCLLCPNPKNEARNKVPYAVLGRESVKMPEGTEAAPAETVAAPAPEALAPPAAMAEKLAAAGLTGSGSESTATATETATIAVTDPKGAITDMMRPTLVRLFELLQFGEDDRELMAVAIGDLKLSILDPDHRKAAEYAAKRYQAVLVEARRLEIEEFATFVEARVGGLADRVHKLPLPEVRQGKKATEITITMTPPASTATEDEKPTGPEGPGGGESTKAAEAGEIAGEGNGAEGVSEADTTATEAEVEAPGEKPAPKAKRPSGKKRKAIEAAEATPAGEGAPELKLLGAENGDGKAEAETPVSAAAAAGS
ncbi:MAG: hypothetical protein NTZ65_05175 [Candidatus Berkelbacteria bacterium]|nr:hypothetical protein [Candidatus Berkelbacteria bacterium]